LNIGVKQDERGCYYKSEFSAIFDEQKNIPN